MSGKEKVSIKEILMTCFFSAGSKNKSKKRKKISIKDIYVTCFSRMDWSKKQKKVSNKK